MQIRGHGVWVEVDTAAISHNIKVLGQRASGAEVMGVVKGYGYGHGNPESAQAMLDGGATRIGIARVAEALHLRDAGLTAPVHVLPSHPSTGRNHGRVGSDSDRLHRGLRSGAVGGRGRSR